MPRSCHKLAGKAQRERAKLTLRNEEASMVWLSGEPTLEEALSDPVVRAVMRRDGVDPDALRRLLERAQARIADDREAPRRRCAAALRDLVFSR
jgi:hypothetical protein